MPPTNQATKLMGNLFVNLLDSVIPSSSNESEIKKAYREKVSHFHPDKLESKQLPKEFIEFANSQLAKINQAYDTIRKARENS